MLVDTDPTVRRLRLSDRSRITLGLSCDADGLFLVPDCALIERRVGRYLRRSPRELDRIFKSAYGTADRSEAVRRALGPIADCLARGDLAGAMIRSLLLGLPDLPDKRARTRLARTWNLIKIGFDPDEPRDDRGRWSRTAASPEAEVGLILAAAKTKPVDPKFAAFFREHYALALPIAQRYGVDVSLLLGLAAFESGWGINRQARDDKDPLGMTPDGKTSNHYGSFAEAWQDWGRLWGPRVEGVGGDVSQFIDRLESNNQQTVGPTFGGDYRSRYNTENTSWAAGLVEVIRSVRRRLPAWLGPTI